MLDHLSIQCEDLDAASAFYDTVHAAIGGRRVLDFGTVIGYGVDFPDFWIGPVNTGEASREAQMTADFGHSVVTLWTSFNPGSPI